MAGLNYLFARSQIGTDSQQETGSPDSLPWGHNARRCAFHGTLKVKRLNRLTPFQSGCYSQQIDKQRQRRLWIRPQSFLYPRTRAHT
jgi:hypothetical protein